MVQHSIIKSTGIYIPRTVVTNDEISKTVDTNDEWIKTRTGITQRYISEVDETTSYMAAHAAQDAVMKYIKSASKILPIDGIICATSTPDNKFPATAAFIDQQLSLNSKFCFDVNAACFGFLQALITADLYIKNNMATNVLVVGADRCSSILDWSDRSTCILFGDGAGATLLSATDDESRGFIEHYHDSDTSYYEDLKTVTQDNNCYESKICMTGSKVFKKSVKELSAMIKTIISDSEYEIEDIDWIVPHQANIRILYAIADAVGVSRDKFLITIDKYANTSTASLPMCLDYHSDKFKKGDKVILVAIGAGLSYGASLLVW